MSTLNVNSIKTADGTVDLLTYDQTTGAVTGSAVVQSGRRNLIINGAMQVAQRGTSFTATGYTVDRRGLSLSGGTATVTQESFALGQTEVSGNPKNYLKVACSVGDNNCGINQPIENYAAGAGGKVTLSFWAKGTNPASGYFDLQLWQRMANGTGFHETALTLNSDWTYHTFIFELGSLSGFTANSSSSLDLIIRQPVGDSSTDAWELNITNVQLEVGSVATPFEHRSYGEELALCQRYYQTNAASGDFEAGANTLSRDPFVAYSNANMALSYRFPVEMRAAPSISFANTTINGQAFAWYNGAWRNGSINATGRREGFNAEAQSLSATPTQGYAYISQTNWSADAEL